MGALLIKNAINKLVEQAGYNPKLSSNEQKIIEYTSYYKGVIDKFHTYKEKVNGKLQNYTRKSSQTAKMVSEEWASIIWSELLKMIHSDKAVDKSVKETLTLNNFNVMYGHAIEYAFGQSEHLTTQFLEDNEVFINFFNINNYMVLDHWNGIPTAVYSWDEIIIDKVKYMLTSLHTFEDKTNKVINKIYKITAKGRMTTSEVSFEGLDTSLQAEHEITTNLPLFQVTKPNVANNHDFSELRGIAIHANAVDDIKTIDIISTGYEWEYVSGENKVILTKEVLDKDVDMDTGAYIASFDATKRTYVAVDGISKSPVNVVQWIIRADKFDLGMTQFYSRVAQRCGLGPDYFNFKEGTVYINKDAVYSSKGPLFRNKAKHEQIIDYVIRSIWNAIIVLKKLEPKKDSTLTIEYDDSLFTDKDAEEEKSMIRVERGFKTKGQHLLDWDPTITTIDEGNTKALELNKGRLLQDMEILGINGK